MGQAGLDCGLACRVLPRACSQHLAEDDFINLRSVDPGLFEQATNHRRAQFGGWDGGQ